MKKQSHLQAFRLIRKNRRKRKIDTYKLALSVVLDKTTAFYLLILVVYGVMGFFIANDFINDYYEQFLLWEEIAKQNIGMLFTILPLGYLFQSFKQPGVILTSSEYQLSLLPYSLKKIWLLSSLEKWLKQLIIFMIMGGLVIVLTPLSFEVVFSYIAIAIFIHLTMTIPQWKLFGTRWYVKLGWILLLLLVNGINFTFHVPNVSILMPLLLIISNIIMIPKLFDKVEWARITEMSDFQIWSMWFVSKVSEVDFKPPRKLSIFRNLTRRKKPFQYEEKSIHHRLWAIYLRQHIQDLFKIIGALFLLVFVFSWLDEWVFHIVIAVAIIIYFSIARSFFIGRFEADLVQVLPWNLSGFKDSYFKWVIFGALILFIPVGIYFITHASYWLPIQLLYLIITIWYLYHITINRAIMFLNKQLKSKLGFEVIGYILLFGWMFSWKFKFVLLFCFVIPVISKKWYVLQPIYNH